MGGRARARDETNKVTILGRWVPNGSFETVKNLSRSVCYDRTNLGPPYRSGGALYIAESHFKWVPSASHYYKNPLWGLYSGQMVPSGIPRGGYWGNIFPLPGGGGFSSSMDPWINGNAFDPLEAQGATGWKRSRPDKPIVDLGQFFGELHNVPSVPGKSAMNAISNKLRGIHSRVSFAKATGDEYLNAAFGWKPLLSDLSKILTIRESLDKRLGQLRRDNGRPVKRGVTLINVENSEPYSSAPSFALTPDLHPFYYVGHSGKWNALTTQTRKDWFKASFRYFIPELTMPGYPGMTAAALLGLNPSPSLLWELTPWSWLLDYFANTGDVLSNIAGNAADNLVADYAYVMSTVSVDRTIYASQNMIFDSGPQVPTTVDATCTYGQTVKRRSSASPFGFGLKPGDLSGSQAAILSALGLSRHW